MNIKQKQQAMIKLAQVRLAINHVLRKRAMAKQGSWLSKGLERWWNWFNQPPATNPQIPEWQQHASDNFFNNFNNQNNNSTPSNVPPGSPAAGNSGTAVGRSTDQPWQQRQRLIP